MVILLQILISIRNKRQAVEAINYSLLYCLFVGLKIEHRFWDHSTFSVNRERLLNGEFDSAFFGRFKISAQWINLARDEHFNVYDTPKGAWASHNYSSVDARVTRLEGYKTSQKGRKRIEEFFSRIKPVGGVARTNLIGLNILSGQALCCCPTYNLVRMSSISGWCDAHNA